MDFYFNNEGLIGFYLHNSLAMCVVIIAPIMLDIEDDHFVIEIDGKYTTSETITHYKPTRLFKEYNK